MSFDPYRGVVITLPFTPASKKNEVVIKRGRRGKHYPAKGDAVKAQEALLRTIVGSAMRRMRFPEPLFDRTAIVRVRVWWSPGRDSVRIHVFQCGVRETHPSRDAANIPALILDALQGPAYANDCQVGHLEVITTQE